MIALDGQSLTCEQLHDIAHGAPTRLHDDAVARMQANVQAMPPGPTVLERKRAWLIGDHAEHMDPDALAQAFIEGHCAGVGELLPPSFVRAAMAARANVLATGLCGVRPQAAEILVEMLDQDVVPEVPSQGSVGAAGDLAPLAHIARVACGYDGEDHGLTAFQPTPKEALALINGATVTAALAALAVVRAQTVIDAAIAACAMTFEAVGADAGCIDDRALAARGHPGGRQVARSLRTLLEGSDRVHGGRLPDAFSLRCAPAVLGSAIEALAHVRQTVERELNGACDNPLLFTGADGEAEWVEAGNFHGAPVALAMDHLKVALTQVATLSERRTFRLSYGQLTPGLPSFLVGGTGLNSGFMLAQYTAASLASECKGLAHPASVDTIPTVQHHEDHVSMGPIAARGALAIVECAADIVGIEALLAAQALDLRLSGRWWTADGAVTTCAPPRLAPAIEALRLKVRTVAPAWEDDGVLHPLLEASGALVRSGDLGAVHRPW